MRIAGISQMRNYQQKVVVITGAASGIGAALVGEFSRRGAIVVLLDLDQRAADRVCQSLGLDADKSASYKMNVADKRSVETAFKQVLKRFGRIDVLVNNAGISHISKFAETDVGVLEKVIQVNLMGAIYCTRAAIASLVGSRGQVIALSSIAGFSPLYGRTGYSASKYGLHGFLETLRSEVREYGVDVLLAAPAFVKTNIEKNTLNEAGKVYGTKKALAGKVLTPEFVAEQIVRAAERQKRLICISPMAKTARFVSKFFPTLYERLMYRKIRREFVP